MMIKFAIFWLILNAIPYFITVFQLTYILIENYIDTDFFNNGIDNLILDIIKYT